MAKTIADKLLIKPNTTIWVSDNRQLPRLTPLPDGVRQVDTMATASVAIIFAADAAALRAALAEHKDQLTMPGLLWVAYPKGNRADINRDSVWPIVAEFGMRPNAQVAVDGVWSALRFRALREGEEPMPGAR